MKAKKISAVNNWRTELDRANLILFLGFQGINASDINEFRRGIRKTESRFMVVKNNLFLRALNAVGLSEGKEMLSGPTGVIFFNGEDEIPLCKEVINFLRSHEKQIILRGGYQNRKPINAEAITSLAQFPNRAAIISQFCGTLVLPLNRFLFTVRTIPQRFLSVLKQAAEKGEGEK